jgi:hypothetical protein
MRATYVFDADQTGLRIKERSVNSLGALNGGEPWLLILSHLSANS